MKGNSTSQVKIRHLRPNEKAYVVDCLAHDLKVKETVVYFKEIFPDFGKGVDPDMLNRILAKRIYDIKRKNRDEIEACCLNFPDSVTHIPIVYPEVRLRYLKRIWDETPEKSLVRIDVDADGNNCEIYRTLVDERLAILKGALLEMRELGIEEKDVDWTK